MIGNLPQPIMQQRHRTEWDSNPLFKPHTHRGPSVIRNVTPALLLADVPRCSTCQDFLAQMNLVALALGHDGSKLIISHVDGALERAR